MINGKMAAILTSTTLLCCLPVSVLAQPSDQSSDEPPPALLPPPVFLAPAPTKVSEPVQPKLKCRIGRYIYFFTSNSSVLLKSAKETIDNTLMQREKCGKTAIVIEGHIDRSDDERNNKSLSLERAKQVKKYIRKKGVRRREITIVDYRSSKPLVKTKYGISEVQNRRAVIRLVPLSNEYQEIGY